MSSITPALMPMVTDYPLVGSMSTVKLLDLSEMCAIMR